MSRTPRTWRDGDDEPREADLRVRDCQGDVWTFNGEEHRWYSPETAPFNWVYIMRKWGPLTEVLPDAPEPTVQTNASETNTAPTGEHTDQDGAAVYGELSDRLADLIFEYTRFVRREDCDDPARAILAAGWRPPQPERPAGSPLSTEPGAVTRLTVNIGPRTAEALNRTRETRGVSLTEALRFLVAAGYSAPPPDGWYPAAMREHDRANAAELDRNAAQQRAASWWEAAKAWCRTARLNHNDHAAVVTAWDKKQADYLSTLAERDEARAKLDQVRAILDEPDGNGSRVVLRIANAIGHLLPVTSRSGMKPERVEWNPAGDTWLPATVVQYRDTPHLVIQLDDGHERLLVETRHTRPVDGEVQR